MAHNSINEHHAVFKKTQIKSSFSFFILNISISKPKTEEKNPSKRMTKPAIFPFTVNMKTDRLRPKHPQGLKADM